MKVLMLKNNKYSHDKVNITKCEIGEILDLPGHIASAWIEQGVCEDANKVKAPAAKEPIKELEKKVVNPVKETKEKKPKK